MATPEPPSERTRVRRLAARGVYDSDAVYGIIDAALVCHVGFVVEGAPRVIPTLHGRDGDALFLHGSVANQMLRTARGPAEICVTATVVDGLVLARSAFHHSINYRSAVVFGQAEEIDHDEAKLAALRTISEHVLPGRWDEVRPPSPEELRLTSVLTLPLAEASAKVRTGPPIDDEDDLALPVWAGVLPLTVVPGEPIADPALRPGLDVPASVLQAPERF